MVPLVNKKAMQLMIWCIKLTLMTARVYKGVVSAPLSNLILQIAYILFKSLSWTLILSLSSLLFLSNHYTHSPVSWFNDPVSSRLTYSVSPFDNDVCEVNFWVCWCWILNLKHAFRPNIDNRWKSEFLFKQTFWRL